MSGRRGNANTRRARNVSRGATVQGLARMVNSRLRIDVNGRKFTPNRSPPEIVQTPWNSLVLTIKQTSSSTAATPININAAQVFVALRAQLAGTTIPHTALGELRFSMVEAWNMGNTASISMDVFPIISLSTTSVAKMIRLEDNPGKNTWACVGYEWPRSQRNYVVPSDVQVPLISVYSDIASSLVWIRFHILWRFRTSAPPDYTFGGLFDPERDRDGFAVV